MPVIEQVAVDVLPKGTFYARVESGLLIPRAEGPLRGFVDCGDERPLTPESFEARLASIDNHTERFDSLRPEGHRLFGAHVGVTLAGLVALTAQLGEERMRSFVGNYGPDFIPKIAAEQAGRLRRLGIAANTHSDDHHERNGSSIKTGPGHETIGCAFIANMPTVAEGMSNPRAIAIARTVLELGEQEAPAQHLTEAANAAGVFHRILIDRTNPGRVNKEAYVREWGKAEAPAPIILAGSHAAPQDTGVYIDFAGLHSSNPRHNRMGTPHFMHTATLPTELLELASPDLRLDKQLVTAVTVLSGIATRNALDPSNRGLALEVIPANYRLAA